VIRIVAPLLFAVVLAGCEAESFTELNAPRSPLLPGFEHYAHRHEVLPGLTRNAAPLGVEDSVLPPGDRRPPFSIYTIRVAEFAHLGQPGALQLSFLMTVCSKLPSTPQTQLPIWLPCERAA
jgi:hypothetical protein